MINVIGVTMFFTIKSNIKSFLNLIKIKLKLIFSQNFHNFHNFKTQI